MGSLVDSIQTLKSHNVQMLEEHANRVDSLEHNCLNNEKVIEEQAQKIKSLEATVQKLETRLELYHQTYEHGVHKQTGRFECMQLSLNHFVQKLRETSQQGAKHLNSPTLTNFNEENGNIYGKPGTSLVYTLGEVTVDETGQGKLHEDSTSTSSSTEQENKKQNKRCTRRRNPKPQSSTPDFDIWKEDDILKTFFENPVNMAISPEVNEPNDKASCECCGLHCKPQLMACVNMIHAGSTMKKVEEKEIQAMKEKRKLEKK